MSIARHSGIDLAVLRDALRADIEAFAETLLGPRNRTHSTRRSWRWGSKGSLVLEIAGLKRGRWYDHEACEGGGPIELIQHARRCNFAEAVSRGTDFTGLLPANAAERARHDEQRRRERFERQKRHAAEEAEERAANITHLRRRLRRMVSIPNTLGERYLIETRCIPRPPGGWPDVLRYDPHDKALVVIATDANSEPQAAQWIYLTDDARKDEPSDGRLTKLTRGPVKGAAVRLPGRPSAPLQIAEGPETGLSLWASTGCETWIALGSIASLPVPPTARDIVACLDDDPRHGPSARLARKTLSKWRRRGVQFLVAKPWSIRREDKSDFNDVLRSHGTGAIEERILRSLEPGYSTRQSVPVAMARFRLRKLVAEEADAVLAGSEDDITAFRMDAGGGKTEIAIREGAHVVRSLRARGDMHTVVIATPRGDLNHKTAARANTIAPDVTVAVYHGADADNPEAPGEKMCRNPEARRAAEIRRLDQTKLICPVCPMRNGCAYRAQAARRADIWLVPHHLLFVRKPSPIGDLAWLIIDENPVAAALIGVGDPHAPNTEDRTLFLTIDTLRRADRVKGNAVDTERLHAARAQLIGALEASPNARMMRAALIESGLTADTCEQAIGLEYATKILPATHDGMALEDRLAELHEADANCDLDRRVTLWREAAALLRGKHETAACAEIVTLHEAEGMVRAVRSKGRRMIGPGWRVRTTIIDATLQPDLLRQIWPNVVVHDLGALDAPHRHVAQVVDRAFSLAMLDAGDPRIDAKERKRREANLGRLHVTLARLIRKWSYHSVGPSQRILIVAQKRIVGQLQALGPLLGNIEWAHHGAVTGRDDWRDVRAVIVVGRSLPPPSAVEAQAEALTGAPIARLPHGAWYPLIDATRELADGTLVACETVHHPDRIAEAFRWRACEGELVHIIERARGVNRQIDAERVDVVVLTDAPLQMPVEMMISTDDIAPRAEDRMLAAQGVTLTDSEDAARAYPKLWRNGNAVRVLRHRERERHGCDWQPPPGLMCARYRRALNGAHHGTAVFDPAMVPDITAWLRSALGELAEVVLIAPLQTPIRDLS